MKPLTPDQTETIQLMAELFYTYEQICLNAQIDPQEHFEAFSNKEGELFKNYMIGYLKGDIALRQSIKKSADNGSHPAQQLLIKIQEESNIHIKAHE
jgi:hypothetical protein